MRGSCGESHVRAKLRRGIVCWGKRRLTRCGVAGAQWCAGERGC